MQGNAAQCNARGSDLGPPLFTVREVAAKLQVSIATVYKAIHTGLLPAVRVVGQFRIAPAEPERLGEP